MNNDNENKAPCSDLAHECEAGSLRHWNYVISRWQKIREISDNTDSLGIEVISESTKKAQQDIVDLTRWMVDNAYIFTKTK